MSENTGVKRSREEMSDSSLAPAEPPKKVLVGGDAPGKETGATEKAEVGASGIPTSTLPQQAGNGMPPANNQVQQPGIATVPPAAPTRQHSENTASLITSENLSGNGTAGAMSLQGQASPGVPGNITGMPPAVGNATGLVHPTMPQVMNPQQQQQLLAQQQMQLQQQQQLLAQQQMQMQHGQHMVMANNGVVMTQGHMPQMNQAVYSGVTVPKPQPMKVQPKKAQQKLKVEDALAYLAKVKAEFDRKPQIYTKFLDIMKNFKAHTVDTPGVIQQVSQLFRGHDALILGFNTFLPEEQRISLEQLKKMNKAEEEKKRQRKKAAQQRKAKKEKEKKQKAAMDAKARKNQKGTPGQPFGFDHAISYVTKIKRRFAEKPATYREFLDILHLYKEQEQSIEGVLDSVSELFKNEPDLLREFAYFLPEAVQEQAKARLNLAVVRGQGKKSKQKSKAKDLKKDKSGKSSSQGKTKKQGKNVHREEKKEEKKMILLERRFFKRVKAALGQQNLWMEFLKCLELYSREILSKNEFLSLVSDILGALPGAEGEKYVDELEAVLDNRLPKSDLEDETWLSMPASEIDLSHARRSTPSYRCLPKNYPRPTCSMRTALCESVLNNQWISVPTGSEENNSFKNLRRNVFEEKLFKCEDDRYEIDMVMDANRATIRRLVPINEEIERLKKSGQALYQFRLDKRALGVIHLKAIGRVYGDHGNEVLELLRKNPVGAIPVILARLKQKALEWGNSLKSLNEKWKAILEENYQKSLDHRSYYFKAQERKAIMAKTLLQEIKGMKERAKAPTKAGSVTAFPGDKSGGNKSKSLSISKSGDGISSKNKVSQGLHQMKTEPHVLYAYPDIEAHQDAFRIIMHAVTNGPDALEGEDLEEFERVLSEMISSLFGLPSEFISSKTTKISSQTVNADDALKAGTEVFTPFGKGKVKAFHTGEANAQAQCYVVELPVGDAFLAPVNVNSTVDLSVSTSNLSLQMFVGNDLYFFLRLYRMFYARLRKAKELCRNASALKKSQVKHYLDRNKYPSTPRSVSEEGLLRSPRPSVGSAMDVEGSPTRRVSESPVVPAASPVNAVENDSNKKRMQLHSRSLYYDFLDVLEQFLGDSMEQQKFEDRCRDLMGASTASYMVFTLDKLVRNLVKHANEIVGSEVCGCLLALHKYEMASPALLRKRYLDNSVYVLSGDANENVFLISTDGGKLADEPPKGGTHVPGVWQESLPWAKIPSMGFELIGTVSQLRSERQANPSEWSRDQYIKQYMESGSLTTFNLQPKTQSWIYLRKNRALVKMYLDADSDSQTAKKDGRDRRARERASSIRNAHVWGLGKIHVSDQLVTKLSLKDYKLRYVTGGEDFFYRIYPETLDTGDNEDSSSSSSDSDEDGKSDTKKIDRREADKLKMQQYFDIRETKFANWAKVVSDDALREDASFKEQEDRRKAAADSDAQTATNSAALQSDTKMEVETSANDSVQDASGNSNGNATDNSVQNTAPETASVVANPAPVQ